MIHSYVPRLTVLLSTIAIGIFVVGLFGVFSWLQNKIWVGTSFTLEIVYYEFYARNINTFYGKNIAGMHHVIRRTNRNH